MDEGHEELLASIAMTLAVLLLMAQAAVVVMALGAPIAHATLDLASAQDDETEALAPKPIPGFWPWVAMATVFACLGVGAWGALRLYRGTNIRGRWIWALVLAGMGTIWGLFTWRFILKMMD